MNFFHRPIFVILAGLAVWGTAGMAAFAFTTKDTGKLFNSYADAFYAVNGINGYVNPKSFQEKALSIPVRAVKEKL